jgi:hypothetical protein
MHRKDGAKEKGGGRENVENSSLKLNGATFKFRPLVLAV